MRVLLTELGKMVSDGLATGAITINIDLDVKLENEAFKAIKELCEYNNITHCMYGYPTNIFNTLTEYNLGTYKDKKNTNSTFFYFKKFSTKHEKNKISIIDDYKNLNQYPESYEMKLSKILNSQFFTFI